MGGGVHDALRVLVIYHGHTKETQHLAQDATQVFLWYDQNAQRGHSVVFFLENPAKIQSDSCYSKLA